MLEPRNVIERAQIMRHEEKMSCLEIELTGRCRNESSRQPNYDLFHMKLTFYTIVSHVISRGLVSNTGDARRHQLLSAATRRDLN